LFLLLGSAAIAAGATGAAVLAAVAAAFALAGSACRTGSEALATANGEAEGSVGRGGGC
jgi:hypothetical protein